MQTILNMIAGYKTYSTLIIMALLKLFAWAGYPVVEGELSQAIDGILVVLAFIFRMVARPKVP